MLSVQLLGVPQLELDSRPLKVTRRKSRALLYYLAAHSQRLARDQLVAFFWPDKDRSAAQQILRTTLHGLRKQLGAAIVVNDETIALVPDTQVDVRAFESNLQHPTSNLQLLTSTLHLYRGDFLAGFSLPDSPEFDNWVVTQQEHYRRLAVRGFIALAESHEANRDYGAALEALDRALEFDPLQEDLQRAALRLHYLAGDRAGAIRRYENLRRLLAEEMGVPPMSETRTLYDSIIKDTLVSEYHPAAAAFQIPTSHPKLQTSDLQPQISSPLPFVGRASELQTIRQAAAAHRLALSEGEAGIGKTRLAQEFLRTCRAITLTGTARELEHTLPYQPIIEALRSLTTRLDWPSLLAQLQTDVAQVWLAEAARLLPELLHAGGARGDAPVTPADESRLWESINQVLLALGRRHQVVLFIDDLQWADASTLALLGYLVRSAQAADAPICFLATAQSIDVRSPLSALLQTLTREGRVVRLPLNRLTPDDLSALAEQLSPKYAYPLADWLGRTSEGNPHILSELVRYAHENDLLRADGALNLSALSSQPVVPQTVYSLIESRLARLPDAARRVLDAAVAAGREFEFKVIAWAAGLSENAALDAIDELRAARLIEPRGDGLHYAFDHNLTMEVAYREIGEPRHRLLHHRVAEALETIHRHNLDSISGLLAWHFAESGDIDRAAPHAFRAGQLAAELAAWKEALAFHKQALSADSISPQQRANILAALGEAHLRIGESAQATEAFREALALSPSSDTVINTARLGLGQALISQARFAEAIALAKQLLAEGQPQHALNAEVLWGTALSIEGADLAGAAEHLNKADALCAAQADPARRAQINFELGSVAAQQGDLDKAVALYRATLAIADEAGEAAFVHQILARNNLAYHLHLLGDPTAIEYAEDGLRLAQAKGALGLQPFLDSTLGEIALAKGDLDSAEKYFADGLALAERISLAERIAGLTANLGLVAHRRGDTALAIHRLSTALVRADTLGTQHLAAQIRLWLVPLLPPTEARAYLAEARAIAGSSGRKRLLEEAEQLQNRLG